LLNKTLFYRPQKRPIVWLLQAILFWLLATILFIVANKQLTINAVQKGVNNYVGSFDAAANALFASKTDSALLEKPFFNDALLQKIKPLNFNLYAFDMQTADTALVFWSTNSSIIPKDVFATRARYGTIKLPNGIYYWRKYNFKNLCYLAVLPLRVKYFVANAYLRNSLAQNETWLDYADLSSEKTVYPIYNNESVIAYLKPVQVYQVKSNLFYFLNYLGAAFCAVFIFFYCVKLGETKKRLPVFLILVTALVVLRMVMYAVPTFFGGNNSGLFNKEVYSTNIVFSNLANWGSNVFIFILVTYWLVKNITPFAFTAANKKMVFLFGLVTVVFIVLVFGSANMARYLIVDAQISFENLNVLFYDGVSMFVVFMFCCAAGLLYLLVKTYLIFIQPIFVSHFLQVFLSVLILGFFTISILLNFKNVFFELGVLLWLLVFLTVFFLQERLLKSNRFFVNQNIIWYLFLALSLSSFVGYQVKQKELGVRKSYAEALLNKTDVTNKALMNMMLIDFRNELLTKQFDRFFDREQNLQFKDSIINRSFATLLNKYDINIFTFDKNENALFNNKTLDVNAINSIINTEAKLTSVPDLFLHDVAFDKYRYIGKKVIVDSFSVVKGYVYITLDAKDQKSQTIYPELFARTKDYQTSNKQQYSYAVYNKGKLAVHYNDYVFPTELKLPPVSGGFTNITNNGHEELWYIPTVGQASVIVHEQRLAMDWITLFSYFFCCFLILALLIYSTKYFLRGGIKQLFKKATYNFSIRTQIQFIIVAISVVSFIIIGAFIILFFVKRYEKSNKAKLSRAIKIMGGEAKNALANIAMFDDVLKIYDSAYIGQLKQTVKRISEIHDADINLFDIDGTLKVSSFNFPFERGIVSTKMNADAYVALAVFNQTQFSEEEYIGKLKFTSYYIPVMDESGKPYAFLNIPYYTSQNELQKEISSFIITIINLNAFIFLMAGLVAFFITNRITKSFTVIAQKMQDLNYLSTNQKIAWQSKDEIGILVHEYNKMVDKLEHSAAALAKTERESAWREMARQVAHEIKNPLTPMKLNLQYLQKAIEQKQSNVAALTANVATNLVEQIGYLTNIADEFSQFANIGNPKFEAIDIIAVINNIVALNAHNEDCTITFVPKQPQLILHADKTQMNRLFTNLIVNAIQAKKEGVLLHLNINVFAEGETVKVLLNDDGVGIPKELADKIFMPNFTTKNSGTGLGLAMCKSIVEQHNGSIGFTTIIGGGTQFEVIFNKLNNA
jgi:two-component system, NtrC family, nitrogen regulation sensor histidine kinase NtrY